jgi:ABC-2 type transport system permease protein
VITLLRTETAKLRGSLALVLALMAPALPGAFALLALVASRRLPSWDAMLNSFAFSLWALFLLPMTLAAFTALVGQIEHRAKGWDQLLALPIPRWQVFAAKLVIVLMATIAMTALVAALTVGGGALGGLLRGEMPTGTIDPLMMARTLGLILAASGALIVLQLWSALRFPSFVVPLGVGIAGTMVTLTVAITRVDKADYFPWVMPLKTLAKEGDPTRFALAGLIGGAVLAVLMVVDLARRDFR